MIPFRTVENRGSVLCGHGEGQTQQTVITGWVQIIPVCIVSLHNIYIHTKRM